MSKNKDLMKEFIRSFKDPYTYDPRVNLSARWALLWCTLLLILGIIHIHHAFQLVVDFTFGIIALILYPTLGATGTIHREREKTITDYSKNLEHLVEQKTEQLAKNEKKYRTLFEIVPAGMFRVTEGLEIADINSFALGLLGLPHDKVIGQRCLDLICKGGNACKLSSCCSTEDIVTTETTLQSVNGVPRSVVISCRNWKMEGKASIIGSITDITERKKLEETILENKRKLESIFDGMEDGIIVIDQEQRIAAINRKQAAILGAPPEQLIGKDCSEIDFFTPHKIIKKVFRTGTKDRAEVSFPSRNGEEKDRNIFMDIIYAPVKNKEGEVEQVIEVLRDITEMRELEEQIRRSERWVTIGEIATCVAHEINNPICIIRGFTQRILKKTAKDSPNYHALKIIERECDRCSKIVKDVLNFARPEIPKKSLLEREKIVEIIDDCLKLLEFRINEREIQLSLEVDSAARINIDPNQFQQVLLNLFLNAIQAMPNGGKLRISVSTIQTHQFKYPLGSTLILIEDTGVGICPEIFPRIFELFFTTKHGGKDGTGTGLGLPITKRIIEAHEGTISVESEPGQGTRIMIELPL